MASPNAAGTSGAKESSLTALLSRLDKRKIPYFYKLMTMTAVTQTSWGPLAYAMRFPASFVRANRSQIGERATFQRTNCDQTWPIKITMKVDRTWKCLKVFAYGRGGWKAFVVDNGIQVGDTLVFSLVGSSSFAIDIIKASAAPPAALAEAHKEEPEPDRSLDPSPVPKNNKEASLPCKRRRREVPSLDGPRFAVHLGPEEVNELRVPGEFCDRFRDMLRRPDWVLRGPNGVIHRIKAARTFREAKQGLIAIHLETGWKHFFVTNGFRIGDLLKFSMLLQAVPYVWLVLLVLLSHVQLQVLGLLFLNGHSSK